MDAYELAPQLARPLAPLERIRPGTAVRTAAGAVSALFMLEYYDRRTGVATYGLRVVNQTAATLICRVWAVAANAVATLACPTTFEVAPQSTFATPVTLRPREFDSFERAFAEVAGAGLRCVVESAPLVRHGRRAGFAAALGAAVLLTLATIVGLASAVRSALPQIGAFAVAPMALSGTTVRAEYAASGIGALSYRVTGPDGSRLQGGTLSQRSGDIVIALPASADAGAYTLQLSLNGPLGNAKEIRVLNALATRHAAGAQIASVSVTPPVATPGQPIDVSYAASGDGGYLRLTGTDGTVWSQKPFSRSGAASFVVPRLAHADQMRVVLHVTRGRSSAESSAGFVVAPATAVLNSNATAPAGTDSGAPGDLGANGTFRVLTPSVTSGGTIRIDILSPRDRMHLALVDGSTEVAAVDVGSDAGIVTLKAPAVKIPTRYTVVASFVDGFGSESIVAPVTVRP